MDLGDRNRQDSPNVYYGARPVGPMAPSLNKVRAADRTPYRNSRQPMRLHELSLNPVLPLLPERFPGRLPRSRPSKTK